MQIAVPPPDVTAASPVAAKSKPGVTVEAGRGSEPPSATQCTLCYAVVMGEGCSRGVEDLEVEELR